MARFKRVFVLAVTALLCGAKVVQATNSVYRTQSLLESYGWNDNWEDYPGGEADPS